MAEESGRIKLLSEQYGQLRLRKQELNQQLKDLGDEMEQISQELVKLLQDLEMQSAKVEGVGTVYLRTQHYVSANKEKIPELVAWLDEHGYGDLAPRSVNQKTLQSNYNTWSGEDKPLPPPELVSAYPKTEIGLRKA